MDHDERTDAELVARTLAADRQAFGQLYDRHARIVRDVVGGVSLDWSEVGAKEIDGKKAQGFEIDAKRIDPDSYPGPVEIWVDVETKLPTQLRLTLKPSGVESTMQMEGFQWNVDLAPELFDPTPPEGYEDKTPEPPSVADQVRAITGALKLYAELSGGHYPRVKMVYGDVTRDEMRKMAGFEGQPTPEQLQNKRFNEITQATRGLGTINSILRDNPDAAYYGLEVGPPNREKVLLRWKLADDGYQVIFGDLRSETVSSTRLKELEGA